MELTHSFSVPASVDVCWQTFNDLERIAPCMPGASLSSYDGDEFTGSCKVKLGPVSLQYNGSGRFVERDEAAHRAVIEAKGKDRRGNGTAAANVTATLTASGASTTDVTVQTDLNVTGKPAQFGRGMMQDVGDKLLGQFADCLEKKLSGASEAESAATGSTESARAEAAGATAATQATESADVAAGAEPEAGADAGAFGRHRAESAGADAGLGTATPSPNGATPSAAAGSATESADEPAALDLGATVLPVLLKRYAPYLAGAAALLVVVKALLGRRKKRS